MARLHTSETPLAGMFAGPGSDPHRYELVERLSPPQHEFLKEREAGSVWRVKETQSGAEYTLKIFSCDHPGDSSSTPYEGIATRLWKIAGYTEVQKRGAPVLPSSHPGQQHCIRILDYFQAPFKGGPEPPDEGDLEDEVSDGFVVLEKVGPSLATWRASRPTPFLPSLLVRPIIRQLLLAVDYLQDGLPGWGIAHCGLSLDNILLDKPTSLDRTTAEDPEIPPCIKLAGFGFSQWLVEGGYEPYRASGSRRIRSAEQLLLEQSYGDFGLTSALDIWAIGVVTSLLLFDKNLALNGHEAKVVLCDYVDPLRRYSTTSEVVVALASIDPEAGWPRWFEESILVKEPDTRFPFSLPGVHPLPPLDERVEAEGRNQDPAEVKQLASFLKACWVLDPEKRPSAKQLLEHEWLRGVE